MKRKTEWKCECGNTPCDGLECGIYLPGEAPRKKPEPKPAAELSAIRKRAWVTRRSKTVIRQLLGVGGV